MTGKPEVIPADPIRAITFGWPTTRPKLPDPLRSNEAYNAACQMSVVLYAVNRSNIR